jgi:hypothetical protein
MLASIVALACRDTSLRIGRLCPVQSHSAFLGGHPERSGGQQFSLSSPRLLLKPGAHLEPSQQKVAGWRASWVWLRPGRPLITSRSTRTHKCIRALRAHAPCAPVISNVRRQMQTTVALVLVAVAVGVPLGVLVLVGEWEKKARHLPPPWLPFGHRSMPAIVLGMVLVKVPLSLAIFLGAPYFVLDYFGHIPLRGENHQIFFVAYLLALCAGKLLRYAYWRLTFRGQLV